MHELAVIFSDGRAAGSRPEVHINSEISGNRARSTSPKSNLVWTHDLLCKRHQETKHNMRQKKAQKLTELRIENSDRLSMANPEQHIGKVKMHTKACLITRLVASLLRLIFSRLEPTFSTFLILSKYCLTRAISVETACSLGLMPFRRRYASYVSRGEHSWSGSIQTE